MPTSSIVASSSESATPATARIDDGILSAATSTAQKELARAQRRIWGDNPDTLHPPMRMGTPPILASSPSRASGATWQQTGLPLMALVRASCRQRTMV